VTPDLLAALTLGVFLIALLYASVGHAGASGYIAVMALFSVAPEVIKPTALTLNVLVASIASYQFWRAGHFSWALFWPFALLAIPLAFAGGWLNLPAPGLKLALGMVLLFSAANFLLRPAADQATRPPPRPVALGTGGALGFLAGVSGTGGGIFLTPLLLHLRWSPTKTAAAVSALFILGNSAAGLAGVGAAHGRDWPALALPLAVAVIAGGTLGAYYGSRRFPQATIKRFLAAVLTIAGGKLVLTAV
jgi:uncharacterized membrane protein YfcA